MPIHITNVYTRVHTTRVGEKHMVDISKVTAKYNHCPAVVTSQVRLTVLRVRPAPMAVQSTEEGRYLKPLKSRLSVLSLP